MRSTRREFVCRMAAGAAAAVAAPAILPSSALGASGQTAPGNRVAVGLIGMGKMMYGHLRNCLNREDVQVVALCDVDRERLAYAAKAISTVLEAIPKASATGADVSRP